MSLETLKVKIIKKAWSDPAFKASLLADPKSALKLAFDIDVSSDIQLDVVEEASRQIYLVIPPSPENVGDGNSSVEDHWN